MNGVPGGALLLAEAWVVALSIRVVLWSLPFSRVLRIVEGWSRPGPRHVAPGPERIAAAVRRAGRLVPASSCLTRAFAVHVLLSRAGHPSRLRIGLRQGSNGALQAHAWVECRERVVLGAEDREGFVPLPALEKR